MLSTKVKSPDLNSSKGPTSIMVTRNVPLPLRPRTELVLVLGAGGHGKVVADALNLHDARPA